MHGWIEPFYEPAEPALDAGHVWSHQPVYLPPRHALRIERVDPLDDTKLAFTVRGRTPATFDHPPLHGLGLESGEAAVVTKAKRDRPVIVLGGSTATQLLPGSTSADETVMVVPVYAAARFDADVRRRIARYEFTNAFYLPTFARPGFEEAFARLDHAQPVSRSLLAAHRGLKLSSDALDALVEWFVAFATNRRLDDSLILDYRRERLAND